MVLQGGFAAAVSSMSSVSDALHSEPAVPTALKRSGVRAIDIHAHYYPQAYLDLFNTEGRRFNAEFRMTEQGFYFSTADESDGPLPTKFIDLKQRLADMDAQGVAVHALSLTDPMVYWADGEVRIMMGSDYCFGVGYDRPVEVVEDLRFSSEQRKMILGDTAAKILKI
jgi:aminocarboxymuconate-semialdehyde decarboxylase